MLIKYFAWLKNITNTEEEEVIDKNITDVKTLKEFLFTKYPKFNQYMKEEQGNTDYDLYGKLHTDIPNNLLQDVVVRFNPNKPLIL